jgi:protein ImuB
MYACLHLVSAATAPLLLDLARAFSPVVEQASSDTVVFSIAPLRKLIGSPHQIASEICRAGNELKLQANLAIASNPDAAILLARHFIGVTLVTPGEEQLKLASLPLTSLFTHHIPADPMLLGVLERWGLKTCADLAILPERGVAERLGDAGVYLRNLACGQVHRPLRVAATETNYHAQMTLEHPLQLLEPLLFLLARTLTDVCARLRSQSMAARSIAAEFQLERHEPYHCTLEFPVPVDDGRTILKLLQLHLERHSPEAPVTAFSLSIEPVEPKRVQGGIFLPPTPQPDKLQLTLARIAGMVGKENVGTPVLLNTHRPDAFEMTTLPADSAQKDIGEQPRATTLRLVMRLFRPALDARVRVVEYAPKHVVASVVKGRVMQSAGPWKTSGEWWAMTAWNREEWDVALDDGGLYRIYQETPSGKWYVQGVYD